jgi:hypothetical protein
MRKLALLLFLFPVLAGAQSYPSPTFDNLTILGTCTGCGGGGFPPSGTTYTSGTLTWTGIASGNFSSANTWTALQTFGNITVTGTCTGCGSASGGSNTIQGNAGSGTGALTPAQTIGVLNSGTANAQTGNYTLVLSDANNPVTENSTSANAVTIPPNSSVAFPIGTLISIEQINTGTTSITLGSGVTVQSPGQWNPTASLGGEYGFIQLSQVATNVWNVVSYQPGNTKFTVGGTCATPASTAGGATGGTITQAASGTVNSCTYIITPGAGMTANTLLTGIMADSTQPTIPAWKETSRSTTNITFTVPAALAANDVLSVDLSPH